MNASSSTATATAAASAPSASIPPKKEDELPDEAFDADGVVVATAAARVLEEELIEAEKMQDPEASARALAAFKRLWHDEPERKDEILGARFGLAVTLISSPEQGDKLKGCIILDAILKEAFSSDGQARRASLSSVLNFGEVLYYAAVGKYKLGRLAEARQHAQMLVKLAPDNRKAAALFELIRMKMRQERERREQNVGIGLGIAAIAVAGLATLFAAKR